MQIILASQSIIKITATENALYRAGFSNTRRVINVKANSNGPEQPVEHQIYSCACSRIESAKSLYKQELKLNPNLYPHKDESDIYYLAIESGLLYIKNIGWVDIGYVVCCSEDIFPQRVYIATSKELRFPTEETEIALQNGCTVGQVLKKAGIVKKHDDPHLCLSGVSRAVYLEEAIYSIFLQMKIDPKCPT